MPKEQNLAPPSRGVTGDRGPVLYHYTTFPGLSGIVSSKSLWATKIQFLNDTEELKNGFRVLSRVCQQFADAYDYLQEVPASIERIQGINVFVSSFSEVGDQLSQWRGYASNGGVAISFSFERLKHQVRQQGLRLEKCIYDNSEKRRIAMEYVQSFLKQQKVSTTLSKSNPSYMLVSGFLPIAARFKDSSFDEEREWRLISNPLASSDGRLKVHTTDSALVPYMVIDLKTGIVPQRSEEQPSRVNEDICIDGVTVGPHHRQEMHTSSISFLFETNQAYWGSISRSYIPYRML